MQIHASTINSAPSYQSPFSNVQKRDDSENTDNKSINATQIKAKQSPNLQSNAMKSLSKQMQNLQESIEKVQQDEKLSEKEKTTQVQEMQKQMQELQRQMAETQQKEQEEMIKAQQEKRADEEAKHLSPEENEQKAQEAQQKALSAVAAASGHLKAAVPFYYEVKKYRTQAQLGMGSKYGGNLSAGAVDGLFSKSAQYGTLMAKELGSAGRLAQSALKATEEYNKHKKAEKESKSEDKENDDQATINHNS